MKKIIIISFLLFPAFCFGQKAVKVNDKPTLTAEFLLKPILKLPDNKLSPNPKVDNKSLMLSSMYTTPQVEYNTTIFCKFEHKLMMSSRFPLKMRLGDVQYVDRLEGKK